MKFAVRVSDHSFPGSWIPHVWDFEVGPLRATGCADGLTTCCQGSYFLISFAKLLHEFASGELFPISLAKLFNAFD